MSALVIAASRRGYDMAEYAQAFRAMREPDTWLYFVRAGSDGPIKIGVGVDPFKRLSQLQLANPLELILLGASWSSADEERALHRLFADISIRGEWFQPIPELVDTARECEWMFGQDLIREFPNRFPAAVVSELEEIDALTIAQEEAA